MKKLLAALVILVAGTVSASAQTTLMRIAAVVNDDMVSVYDLETRLRMVLITAGIPDTEENRQRETPAVLRQLITETIQVQEARRLNLDVTTEEIRSAVREIERRNGMPEGGLIRELRQQGVDLSTYLQQLRANIAWGKVLRTQLAPQIRVSDEEVEAVQQRLQEQGDLLRYSLSEIFLPVDSAAQDEPVRRTAERLMTQIERGVEFGSLARQFSQSSTAATGGDMGELFLSQVDPALRPAVEQMRSGQAMGPIRTVSGYYILFLRARRSLTEGTPDDTLVTIAQAVMGTTDQRGRAATTRLLTDLANDSETCEQLIERVRGAGGRAQMQEDLIVSRLPSALTSRLRRLEPGQHTGILPSQQGVGLYMLCRRQAPGLPTEAQIRRTIASQKLDALARRYLRELRRRADIEIRI